MSDVQIKYVGTQQLFNLPLYEHHLVIDTRPLLDYQEGHVATAAPFPGPPLDTSELDRERKLIEFIRYYIKEYLRPENPSPIVIYGNEEPESKAHGEWLIKKLEKLHYDRKALTPLATPSGGGDGGDISVQDIERMSYFDQFCTILADYTREIWLLECSYQVFRREFGFLCGHVDFSSMFPLPHQIADYLFLGSRAFPMTRHCLSELRISHMIVSDKRGLDWSEFHGISVLKCHVEDSSSQDMRTCWEASNIFIQQALHGSNRTVSDASITEDNYHSDKTDQDQRDPQTPIRILVMLFGRSRSTSVILAHLIQALKMSFERAWDTVNGGCWHLIDRSLVYEDQLREWERRYVTISAIHFR